MSTMLAAVLHDFNDLKLEEVPMPQAKGFGDVVVRVKSCGICATDYKAIKGIRRNVKFPCIVGHEPSGVVAEVGPGVTHFEVGDEVIYGTYSASDVEGDGREIKILRETDILAKVIN